MSIPQPKYKIGDRVYRPWVNTGTRHEKCPDCADVGAWLVHTPVGESFFIPCSTCSDTFDRRPLRVHDVGCVNALTIGSVRVDTAAKPHEQVSYMCRETGIGSGSVYYEGDLFDDRESAQRVADFKAIESMERRQAQIEAEAAKRKRAAKRRSKR